MRRRLISILAAVLAAGTLFGAAGAASASGAAVHRRGDCTFERSVYLLVTKSGVNYFVGTPNTTFAGATVRLKPSKNGTTLWKLCLIPRGTRYVLYNRSLVMTTNGVPSSNVTVRHAANLGNGTPFQQWKLAPQPDGTVRLSNVGSGQFLRVRNSGPIMGQTVTTGFSATNWSEMPG